MVVKLAGKKPHTINKQIGFFLHRSHTTSTIPGGTSTTLCLQMLCSTFIFFFLSTPLINYRQRYLMPLPDLILRNAEASLAIPPPAHSRAGEEKDVVLRHAQAGTEQTEPMPFSLTPVNQ